MISLLIDSNNVNIESKFHLSIYYVNLHFEVVIESVND